MVRFNCTVFLLITDSCARGLPFSVFISSGESEKLITIGLEMLKEVLPDNAFGGSGRKGPLAS